jgi:hypothetical protein
MRDLLASLLLMASPDIGSALSIADERIWTALPEF